jgi:hypothetical protein
MNSRFFIVFALVALALVYSCENVTSDPKKELLDHLNGVNVQGYAFASFEDDANAMASLTNGAIKNGLTERRSSLRQSFFFMRRTLQWPRRIFT